MGGLVLLDLWTVERHYIKFSPPARESFAPDAIVRTLQADSGLYRVLALNEYGGLENYFMSQRIRSVLGYHGNELQRYDELLGGKNEWRNIGSPNVLKLLAVRYVVLPQAVQTPLLSAVEADPHHPGRSTRLPLSGGRPPAVCLPGGGGPAAADHKPFRRCSIPGSISGVYCSFRPSSTPASPRLNGTRFRRP